jgi:hypothetical protein
MRRAPRWLLIAILEALSALAPFGIEGAEAGAGAMLVAYRPAGLSALETHYAALLALSENERGGMAPDSRPSITSPSLNNSRSDKRDDVSDRGGRNDHLSLSQHHTQGI